MSKCLKCGTRFIGTAENPPKDGLCRYCEMDRLKIALEESVKLQSHYGQLLNMHDGGERMKFDSADAWIKRLEETGTIHRSP